ncbi:MAG: undecaprenyl-diphosphate phosphatase [Planctomycetota bacterium]
MNLLFAILLGIVQGIAEFLPISSSGHLVIAQALLFQFSSAPLPEWLEGMTMNVALHFGTLLSITVVYRRELLDAVRQPRLLIQLIIASIPVAVVGLGFKDALEALFNNPMAAGCCLLVTAGILLTARRLQSGSVPLDALPMRSALLIGLFQAVAVLPGISRAGSTVGAGLMCGLKSREAARFSFFLAIPAIGGATLLETLKLFTRGDTTHPEWLPLFVGAGVSFLVGTLSLRWLIRQLQANRLHWFAGWCLAAGLCTVIWQLS